MSSTTYVLVKPWWSIASMVLAAVALTTCFFLILMGVATPFLVIFLLIFSFGLGVSSVGMLITAKPTVTVQEA